MSELPPLHPLADAVRNDRIAYGWFVLEFASRAMPWLTKQAGLDFLMYDCEHGNLSRAEVRDGVLACRALGVTPMVRVPSGDRTHVSPALDMGAQAILLPLAETAEQVQAAIDVAKYAPEGSRGAAFGLPHDLYETHRPAAETMAEANRQAMVVPLIETVKGVENADAICALPGVEVAWVGPVDLTQSLGKPNDFDNPEYIEAMKTIGAAAEKHGVKPALMINSVEGGMKWFESGYKVFACCADIWLLQHRLLELSSQFRAAVESSS